MSISVPRAPGGWRSRTTFVLALSAAALGLGSLWRFSYLSGAHGGAPFVIAYVACLFLVAVPVLVAEVVLGRHGRGGPLAAVRRASDRSLRSRGWMLLGAAACATGLLMVTLYTVVAGWALAFAMAMHRGVFAAAPLADVARHFDNLLAAPVEQLVRQSVFLALAAAVLLLGVRRGLGMIGWIAVPVVLAMLGFLVAFALDNGNVAATQRFLFAVRWEDFTPAAATAALGHAFYTLCIGVGTGVCFGAYAPGRLPIGRSVLAVAVFDTMIALLAGLAVFPVVFAANLEPSPGPGLVFVSLPYAFGNLGQGEVSGVVFFSLLLLAAFCAAVAVLEPVVSALQTLLRIGRFAATLLAVGTVWLLGRAVLFSLAGEGAGGWFGKRNLFEFFDQLVAHWLLPLVSLGTALFVGWRLRPELLRLELSREPGGLVIAWHLLLRYLVPLAVVLLLLAPLLTPGPGQ